MNYLVWVLFGVAMLLVPISLLAALTAFGVCVGCATLRDLRRRWGLRRQPSEAADSTKSFTQSQ